jgi:hypothetical protein
VSRCCRVGIDDPPIKEVNAPASTIPLISYSTDFMVD